MRNDIKHNNLTILITDICNKSCPACVNQGFVNKYKTFMTDELFNSALKWAKENNKSGIIFNGGEPTLHPNIVHFVKLAKSWGFDTFLFTNYSQPDMVKILDETNDLDRITISNYDQKTLPKQNEFNTPLSLCTIIWNGRFKTKDEFDKFIDDKKYNFDKLFFQTLRPSTQWAIDNQSVDWLESLFIKTDEENTFLYNKKRAINYRGFIIKFNAKETAIMPRHNINFIGEIHENYDWQYNSYDNPPIEILNPDWKK